MMKTNILLTLLIPFQLITSPVTSAQAPNLGTSASFVLFSSNGAIGNTGISQFTGNIGTNNGAITGFGNVNGVMHNGNGVSAQSAADLSIAYNQIFTTSSTFNVAPSIGNGLIFTPGVYAIEGATTLNAILTLDAGGNSNAVFIFKINGTFSTNAASEIKLINGALACNVFWASEGLVSMASNTLMKGTVIANNAAIEINSGVTLEGRALSTTGAVNVDGVLAYTPIGCGSLTLTGPTAPEMGVASCYAVFSGDGAVTNTGTTYVTGDVGSNTSSPTGFNPLYVTGQIHSVPDGSTAQCATDLLVAYQYVNTLPYDIELLYPAQLGNKLVLTPHTYLINEAALLTDTLFLDAQGNANAVFVIQVNGALSTSTYSTVSLLNGAQSENVYWKVEGAVSINDYSVFCGTIISNNGALGTLSTGVILNGRALTTIGAISTSSTDVFAATTPTYCLTAGQLTLQGTEKSFEIYPNPFNESLTISLNDAVGNDIYKLSIYNLLGKEVMNTQIRDSSVILETSNFLSGVYYYKIVCNNETIQLGKLIAQ